MLKKILLVLFLFSFLACSDNAAEVLPKEPTPPVVPSTDKRELMFLIDEGLKGEELIAKYRNDLTTLDASFRNIYGAVSPLQDKYDISVLIYPTWLYRESGYGEGSGEVGVNRIDPALIHTFDFWKQKNVGVYLEIYSSGIYTAQNGELGNLPLVKRRYGKPETVKSLSLDLDCLEDIFSKYEVVRGVRFHELIGSHDQKDNGHGFEVDLTLTTEVAEICKKHGRKLIWGDHDWDFAYTNPGKYGIWLTYLEKACDILGENITVNFNNNGWGSEIISLNYQRTMANFRNGNKWGYSVQSWWWQEKDAQALPKWEDGTIRWYEGAYLDMPIELMAAFTLETFKRGGSLVQFEPSFHLFNFYNPTTPESKRLGQYEQEPDYSGKLNLKRLVDILLTYDENPALYPSMNPADYYVNDRGEMMSNRWSQKPKTYNQNSLTTLGDKVKVFDTYISNVGKWYSCDNNRYRDWVFTGNVIDATRTKIDFRQIDELLVVKKQGNVPTVEFYNYMSTRYHANCNELVKTTTDGDFVALTSLNLKKNYAGSSNVFFGDPDEIVVARSNGMKITFTVYEKKYRDNGAERQNFTYTADNVLTDEVNREFGNMRTVDFVGMLGMRTQNILYKDNTRPVDNLLMASKTSDAQVAIKGHIRHAVSTSEINVTVNLNPSGIKDVKCIDADCDYVDEVVFLLNDNSVKFYKCSMKDTYDFTLQSTIQDVGRNVRKILATRWTTYFKE